MYRLALLAILGCAAPRAAQPTPPRPAPAPIAQLPLWPVPMRVMAWTAEGIVQIGELPDAPPKLPPTTPWFVEPTRTLDRAALERVIVAVRQEHVPGLSLRGQPVAPWLGALRDLPELTALNLEETTVDARTYTLDVPSLRRLYLADTQIDSVGAQLVVAKHPALEVLDLEDCPVGDAGAIAIATLPELRALNLADAPIRDAAGAALGKLPNLVVLDLGRTQVGPKTIAALRGKPLRELFLDGTRVGKEVATLAGLAPGLQRFEISTLVGYKPTDADLAWLAKAPLLVEAGLSNARVHDKLVIAIASQPALRELRVASTLITTAAIKTIASKSLLEEVDLAATPVDDASAAALVAMPHMRMLRLDQTPIGDAGLAATPSDTLVELYVSHTGLGDAGLAILDHTPQLTALGLGDTQVGDTTLARISKLAALRTLVLNNVPATYEAILKLGSLVRLERLYLEGTRVGDSTVEAFAQLRELRTLRLASTDISERSLPVLRTFTLLEELTVGDSRMRAGIADLEPWPRLRILTVAGLPLGDAALQTIARQPTLETLDLSGTDVTDPSPLVGLPHLAVLGLEGTKLDKRGQAVVRALQSRGVEIVR
ncbi:MAG: hypothetical protein WKG01_37310 [Kofleriaceae bacterium]